MATKVGKNVSSVDPKALNPMNMSLLKEFRAFLVRGNVIDLAVAVVIGTAFGAAVKAVVEGIFTPPHRGGHRGT